MSSTAQRLPSADDFAVERVPLGGRRSMTSVMVVRLGTLTAVSQFILGAALGYAMPFWHAFLALALGSVLLQVVAFPIGLAGAREGLASSVLARWSGFGKYGSGLVSLVIGLGTIAWFGVQNAIFADALNRATRDRLGLVFCNIIAGALVTIIVYFGFRWLAWTAGFTVPAFLVAMTYCTVTALGSHRLGELLRSPASGPPVSVLAGATMVAGAYIIGAVLTPDLARFCRNGNDVFWMTLISTFVGELSIGVPAVLMAHAAHTYDAVSIIYRLGGWIGLSMVVLASVKLNDVNLYSTSLHVTNVLAGVFNYKVNRALVTAVLGATGTAFSILGILRYFSGFLTVLGVAIPPIGGVMIVDYFLLRRNRFALDASRVVMALPPTCERVNPVAIGAVVLGVVVGLGLNAGMASLNSLIASSVAYYVIMRGYARFARPRVGCGLPQTS